MPPVLTPLNTCVIADFDGTLIKKVVDGKRVASLMSIMVQGEYVDKEVVATALQLLAHYYPIELDHTLSTQERAVFMEEWWEENYKAFKKYRLNIQSLHQLCDSPLLHLRDHLTEFLDFLHRQDVPLIIYSASGIGHDAIRLVLEKNNVLTPNVRICSNQLVFDEDGYFVEVQRPIIHSANKTGENLLKNNHLSQPPLRRQCLLIGDSLDDMRMSEGIDFAEVIKVAFADEAAAPKFAELFDIVLPLEGGFKEIRELFEG
jgi:HAD superfamily hydrolase (TIGR01544 family)